jgi:hypothetical protein
VTDFVAENRALWAELTRLLHEFPYCDGEYLRGVRRDGDGWWRLADDGLRVPHSYSIKATR